MPEELYTSRDFCELAEKFEELKRENEELVSDKTYLINAAMDGGDKYHYTAHDIAYRDLERKCKALERELLILSVELARRDEIIARLKEDGERLVEYLPLEWVGLCNAYMCRACNNVIHSRDGDTVGDHAPDCPITLHRALMKELE